MNKLRKRLIIINNKLRVFESFAGIGAVSKAIERIGIPHELVGFSEIDKYAIESFCAIHDVDKNLNLGDVCLIDETKLSDFDLYTFGSPCQDFSVAGKQKGATWTCKDCGYEYNPLDVHYSKRNNCPNCNSKEINKTRSSLVCEALRIIRHKKPKYLLMENVKNLVGKQFKPSFDKIIAELEEYGYNTYWDVLNAKNYGVPQSRERVFVVSIRKDIDTGLYNFPKGFDNGLRLKDILEDKIDNKYYLSEEVQARFKFNDKPTNNDIVGSTKPDFRTIGQRDLVYGTDGVMGCLVATDYKQPKQIIEYSYKKECTNKLMNLGNVYPSGGQAGVIYDENGVSPTLVTFTGGGGKQPLVATHIGQRIRKLTPLECFRLMGFSDEDFQKAQGIGISDTQLYKQAGNSIVVDVLYYIFKNLFKL